jgi:hypothetical protein
MTMSVDAMKDLWEWQRRAAGVQERALRAAAKAHTRLGQLDEQRAVAALKLARAVDELVTVGISRQQAAAFLGVTPSTLNPKSGMAKSPGRHKNAAEAEAEARGEHAEKRARPVGVSVVTVPAIGPPPEVRTREGAAVHVSAV